MKSIVELEDIIKNYIDRDVGQVRNVVYALNAYGEKGEWVIYHLKYKAKENKNKIKGHDELKEINDIFLDYNEYDLFGHATALTVVEDNLYMDLYMIFSGANMDIKDDVVLKYPQLYCYAKADLISISRQVVEKGDISGILDILSNCFKSEQEKKVLSSQLGIPDRGQYRLSNILVPSVADLLV